MGGDGLWKGDSGRDRFWERMGGDGFWVGIDSGRGQVGFWEGTGWILGVDGFWEGMDSGRGWMMDSGWG